MTPAKKAEHRTPTVSKDVEEPFDFEAEKTKLKKMTDTELRIYGNDYAKLAKAHSFNSPKWHDVYRLELARLEFRFRHSK